MTFRRDEKLHESHILCNSCYLSIDSHSIAAVTISYRLGVVVAAVALIGAPNRFAPRSKLILCEHYQSCH